MCLSRITQIEIRQADFEALDDKELSWYCIEPIIQKIRGKSFSIKLKTYSNITQGQKSLLIFWIIYGHTHNGIIHFFREIEYVFSNMDPWDEFKKRIWCFEDKKLSLLVEDMEKLYSGLINKKDDLKLLSKVDDLDQKICEILPDSFKYISIYIRKYFKEYVSFKDK